jgi:hypothetical protein
MLGENASAFRFGFYREKSEGVVCLLGTLPAYNLSGDQNFSGKGEQRGCGDGVRFGEALVSH